MTFNHNSVENINPVENLFRIPLILELADFSL